MARRAVQTPPSRSQICHPIFSFWTWFFLFYCGFSFILKFSGSVIRLIKSFRPWWIIRAVLSRGLFLNWWRHLLELLVFWNRCRHEYFQHLWVMPLSYWCCQDVPSISLVWWAVRQIPHEICLGPLLPAQVGKTSKKVLTSHDLTHGRTGSETHCSWLETVLLNVNVLF
jgi:hypothetical protein